MDNIDRRLELIKMMRNEHEENIGRIRKREHILYPNKRLSYSDLINNKTYGGMETDFEKENTDLKVHRKGNWGFYMRLGICMGLFLLFVYMETQNISYFGITHKQIQKMLSETINVNSFAFMEQFPYTLED